MTDEWQPRARVVQSSVEELLGEPEQPPVEETDPSRLERIRKVASDIIKIVITTDPREIASNLRQF